MFLYALFTPFPRVLPHPEDFSPTVYAVAFGACLIALLRVGSWRQFWRYLPVFLLCTLAFLDEIGYGTEVDWFEVQPLTIARYNVQIHDLHNLIGLGNELLQTELAARRWNNTLFAQYLALATILALFGAAFAAGTRLRADEDNPTRVTHLMQIASGFSMAAGVGATVWLFLLPSDPKNALLLGYSPERLAMAGAMLIGSAAPLAWLSLEKARPKLKSADSLFEDARVSKLLRVGAGALLFGVLIYALWSPLVRPPDQRAILARINPLIGWLAAEAWLFLLLFPARAGKFSRPWRTYVQPIGRFFGEHPSYIYTVVAVGLIIGAQIFFDKAWLPLNKWLNTPGFWLNGNWELWTEETWEMTAGFLFLVASLCFPRRAERDEISHQAT